MNIFEQESRLGPIFNTQRGVVSSHDVWQLPLTSKRGDSLDSLAIAAYKEVQAQSEVVSFVDSAKKVDPIPRLKLDILQHIIEVKKAENAAVLNAKANAEKKAKLLELRAAKIDGQTQELSVEELDKMISELG